jgi:hypothetical protein
MNKTLPALMGLLLPLAVLAQSANEANTKIPPNTSSSRNFEGIWLPSQDRGGGPPGGGQGGAPGADRGGGPPGGGAPGAGGPPGGGAPGGGRAVELTGSTLQCAPMQRMSGGGGGMTSLIMQSPTQLVMVSEEDMDIARKIYIGGKHPANLVPQPNGHSVGSWEGNTLVVDSVGYSGKDGKDSGQHVVERLTKQGDVLTSEATVTDASGARRTQSNRWVWRPDLQFNENVCEEGFDRYQVVNGQLDNPNIPPSRDSAK